MRPYGWKQWEWRDEDHAPCTRYVGHGIRSPQRKQRRRKLHQRARRDAVAEIQEQSRPLEPHEDTFICSNCGWVMPEDDRSGDSSECSYC